MSSVRALCWLFATGSLLMHVCSASFLERFDNARQLKNLQNRFPEMTEKAEKADCNSTSCYRYYTTKTAPYFIDSWPHVHFSTGEFYGGSVPIDESDPSRTLFFIFKPAQTKPSNKTKSINEITIWFNGGPGASSLENFFQENGPIHWRSGQRFPTRNRFAWSKLTNVLWIDQPVGTGFSQGKVLARNEIDVAKEFIGFFKNWQKLFGIKHYKIYVTGESYAGRYVPYVSAQMLEEKDETYLNVAGALMYDPCIGDCGPIQTHYSLYQFSKENNVILNLNQSTLTEMERVSSECGYIEYTEKYLQYPPPGPQPPSPTKFENGCKNKIVDLYDTVYYKNVCSSPYNIINVCPPRSDVLGQFQNPYFNRTDVKKAIHAPLDVDWAEVKEPVFQGRDRSPDPIQSVLPQVIEATNRVLVSNGDYDALIQTNGTLLAIQNMTWNGKLGFQNAPARDFVVPIEVWIWDNVPQGIMGKEHYERGLQWVQTYQAGHMQPGSQPAASFRHLEWLLGRIPTL